PTAAGLAIEEPGAIRPAKPRSQGRDPSIVRGHLDGSDPRNEYGTGVVVICSPIEVGFNSQNGVADLPVVPELASPDEYAVAISVVEVHAQEGVEHITIGPGPANVAANIKSGPTERWRRIDWRGRRIRDRSRPHISSIRGYRHCQQSRQRCGCMQ